MEQTQKDTFKAKEFITDFLLNSPPNRKKAVSARQVMALQKVNNITLDLFCGSCSTTKTFSCELFGSVNNTISGTNYIFPRTSYKGTGKTGEDFTYYLQGEIPATQELEFICPTCGKKYYYDIILFIEEGQYCLQKTGQFPSYESFEELEVEKYRNLISKHYIELKQAIKAHSQKMDVAAFVYLRRILENIVETYYKDSIKSEESERFIDKFKSVDKKEKILPEELKNHKNAIYSVLSKGVHDYTEKECEEMYDVVYFIIEKILDIELQKKEEQSKLSSAIKRLTKKIS